jgi:hypothetical protein
LKRARQSEGVLVGPEQRVQIETHALLGDGALHGFRVLTNLLEIEHRLTPAARFITSPAGFLI